MTFMFPGHGIRLHDRLLLFVFQRKLYLVLGRLEIQCGRSSGSFTIWWHGSPVRRLWPRRRGGV